MTHSPDDLVQRKHIMPLLMKSILIDDARTPLIISGPVPQGDRHEFNELKPKIENLVISVKAFFI
jgi:preprotein translocase subunit SecA